MSKRPAGNPRRVTDAQVRMLREWKTFTALAREIGISYNHAKKLRLGQYQHKQPSP